MTEQPHPTPRHIGPVLIAVVTLIMLYWSWGTWPDPLVDFGGQLYVPWQLSTGHVLYRDVTYYNGPLSVYFNALVFRIFGVGLHTIVAVNFIILTATIILVYRLTVRASGRLSATMAGLTFILIFAFGQVVRLGNYNWLTPYHHEVTHGTALGLLAIACLGRYQRTNRKRWIAAAGLLLGAVFLTKAEPTAASFAAVAVQLCAGWWIQRIHRQAIFTTSVLLICTAATAPLIAWLLLVTAMPAHDAMTGVLGSWPWALDSRITSLHFYRAVAGLDDVRGNLLTMLKWTIIYAALLGSGIGLGLMCRPTRSRRTVTIAAFVMCSAIIFCNFSDRIVPGMITPLPICLICATLATAIAVIKRSSPNASLRFGLVVFAAALLAKMGLAPFAYQYGFVLALPATVVLVCAVTQDLPAWVDRRGGAGQVVRAIGLAAWIGGVAAILYSDKISFDQKQSTIAAGTTDQFRGDRRGVQVQRVCNRIAELIPPTGTVAVLPQGLMINYLTRHPTPTPFVNFMPPEVLAVGEQMILHAMIHHPPDVIVMTPAVIEGGHFTLDDRDPYGAATRNWVMRNYIPADVEELSKPLEIMVPRKR